MRIPGFNADLSLPIGDEDPGSRRTSYRSTTRRTLSKAGVVRPQACFNTGKYGIVCCDCDYGWCTCSSPSPRQGEAVAIGQGRRRKTVAERPVPRLRARHRVATMNSRG